MMSKEKRRVPKLRFPGFTEDWEQRKLSDILKVNSGKDYKHLEQGDIPVYGTGGYMLSVNESLSNIDAIGIGRKGTIDKPQYLKAPFWTVDTLFYLTALDKHSILFLYYLMQLMPWKKFDESTGVPSLSKTTIDNINGYVPSNPKEEELISTLFNQLDKSITLHQRKLNNLKLKKKALLQKLFPKNEERYPELRFPGFTDAWEQRKFKDIAFKRGKISEADLPYVEFEDINSGIGTLNKNISQKVGHKKGLLFEAGDVLFGKLRPYLQNWLLCQFAGIAVGDFWVLQPQNVSSAFLYYLIQSEAYQSVANISSGTKMPRSSWPLVSETLFSIPKYKEANMIGEFFLLIDRTITLHQRKLDHLQLQKKALLQQMFV